MAKNFDELKSHFERLAKQQGCVFDNDYYAACCDVADEKTLSDVDGWLVSSGISLRRGVGEQYKQELLKRVKHPNVRDVKDTKDHTHKNKDKEQESKRIHLEERTASFHLNKIIEELKCSKFKDEFLPPWKKREAQKEYVNVPEDTDDQESKVASVSLEDPVDSHLYMIAANEYVSKIKKKVKFDNDTVYTVDTAETPAQKAAGLEVFTELPEGRGLLFPFEKSDHVTFHMGRVKFPIDILFFMQDDLGFKVAKIIHNALPGSLDLWSQGNTACVLELPGGTCAQDGIELGCYCKITDRVEV